jgi:hypothetical protein
MNKHNKRCERLLQVNYKPLKKEIKEDYRNVKISHAHGFVESIF